MPGKYDTAKLGAVAEKLERAQEILRRLETAVNAIDTKEGDRQRGAQVQALKRLVDNEIESVAASKREVGRALSAIRTKKKYALQIIIIWMRIAYCAQNLQHLRKNLQKRLRMHAQMKMSDMININEIHCIHRQAQTTLIYQKSK